MIFISSYSNGNVGLAQELERYLQNREQDFFVLYHPLEVTGDLRSRLHEYRGGKPEKTRYSLSSVPVVPLHYLRCLFTTFWSVLLRARKVDLVVAASNMDAVAALACRLLFPIKVVYVSTDFARYRRFRNPLLNWLYFMADRIVYRWATAVWHLYPERGEMKKYKHRTRTYDVLDGTNFRRIQRLPVQEINRFRMVYIGQINRECRLDEAICAVAELKEQYPQVCLDIISSGDPAYEQRLKNLAVEKGVADQVKFHGQISDPATYEKLLCQCGLGLCMYELDPSDYSWYGTPLKAYLYGSCGLPTIFSTTMGPQTREYMQSDGMGFTAARGELIEELKRIFEDGERYVELRERSIRWASRFEWEDKFDKYLSLL